MLTMRSEARRAMTRLRLPVGIQALPLVISCCGAVERRQPR